MSRKGSLTSWTLERLGFGSLRFQSSSQTVKAETPKEGNGIASSEPTSSSSSSITTITAGELHLPEKSHKKSLREKLWGTKSETDSNHVNSVFYVDDSPVMVTTETDIETTGGGSEEQEKKKRCQQEGTVAYTVEDRDTLEKIAAHFDTTPSELKTLNKLISTVIFPGQILYIPDRDYSPRQSTPSVSSEDSGSQQQVEMEVFGSPQDKPKMDVPLVKSGNSPPAKIPGYAQRQTTGLVTAFDFEVVAPHKLSEDEVQQLDQDCMERFIKLKVKHITDGQGVVKGTLLVTPNAVMFDPDVSDPLVIEHGAEKYGMIAPMDMIISAAMYHDIAAMKMRGQIMEDGTVYPKPEVYHDKSCPMAKEKLQTSQQMEQARLTSSSPIPEHVAKILRNPLNKSESVCSCGVGSDKVDAASDKDVDSTEPIKDGGEFKGEINKGQLGELSFVVGSDANDSENKKDSDHISESISQKDENDNGARVKTSPRLGKDHKKLSVSFSIPEMDNVPQLERTSPLVGKLIDLDDTSMDNSKDPCEQKENTEDERGENSLVKNSSSGDQETRIGNIVYLPVEEDANGEVTIQSIEKTADTLAKLSVDDFNEKSKSDTDLSDLPDSGVKADSEDLDKGRSSSTSSLGPFSPTPHLSAFVNYATGFFQRHASDSSIKDIKDVIFESFSDSKPQPSKADSKGSPDPKDSKPESKFDIPTVSAAPARRRGKMSRHGDTAVAVESAITMDEKPDLLTMDYDKFVPRKSVAYPDPPLYLCLRLGMPQNKNVFHNYSIESYGKRRKKSEYWFSIPREKVDHLYAFFVQWTPEIYGDEEEITPEKRGFVVIDNTNDDSELDMLDEHFGPHSEFQKDWEIISQSEAIKRRSIVFEEPIPLPELIGNSTILDSSHIALIVQELPGRTIGYPWTLMYSTDKHGFSLKTLYRDMAGLESPILIVVKDTFDNVFGALTSCELKYSDSFYGTGETFLFTFYPSFEVFHWSGENNFFIKGNKESLSIGAGQGVYGLWFDEDLYHGRTNRCETFQNDILTSSEDFVVKVLEAWAFIWD